MMEMLTEQAKKMLMTNGIPDGLPDDANPFIRDGSATYLRYDGLTIEPDQIGGVNTCFWWRGHKVYIIRAEGLEIVGGYKMHLTDIEGRMRIDFD